MAISVLIVDDHAGFRAGARELLARFHPQDGALGRVPGRAALMRGAWAPVLVAAIAAGLAVERAASLGGLTAAADLAAGVALVAGGAYAAPRRSGRRAGALS